MTNKQALACSILPRKRPRNLCFALHELLATPESAKDELWPDYDCRHENRAKTSSASYMQKAAFTNDAASAYERRGATKSDGLLQGGGNPTEFDVCCRGKIFDPSREER